MERRRFLQRAAGLGMLVGMGGETRGMEGRQFASMAAEPESPAGRPLDQIGRPVRVVSIGFVPGTPLQEVAALVDHEAAYGIDIITLPEYIRGIGEGTKETLSGPTLSLLAPLARKHRTYIACPINRDDGKSRFNSVVLLDREGQIVCVYNKVFPWVTEFDVAHPISPGTEVRVYPADFGRLGFATCFDINFPEVWQRLADQEAELVLWPSWYSGGSLLQAQALTFHVYVVSSTHTPDCSAYDITGQPLLYSRGSRLNVSRITLDLDRGIYGSDFNLSKRDKLLKEHSEDLIQEIWMPREEWFVLRAKRPGISARQLAREYGLEELPHSIARYRREIDNRRGWPFGKKVWKPQMPA